MSSDRERIRQVVTGAIADALRIQAASVVPHARLFADLGAESLDILDIRFRIEREFGFKIEQSEIFQHLGRDLSAEEIHGLLTVEHLVEFVSRRLSRAEPAHG